MSENKHNSWDLAQMQSLPLDAKIRMTQYRIREWYNAWDGQVYVSFSGGKDSTVLLDIVRNVCGFKDVPAVFVDTGLEYPEIREFVRTFENVVWLKPKMNFKQVIEKYGYPFISKEVSESVDSAKKYIKALTDRQTDRQIIPYAPQMADLLGIDRRINKDNKSYQALKMGNIPNKYKYGAPVRYLQMFGKMPHTEKGVLTNEFSNQYNKKKYQFMLDAPFNVSSKCCFVMKKQPIKKYAKIENRKPITGQMADESKLRRSNWIKYGCNGFDMKSPISNPMSFWTEQDVLQYIKKYNIQICSVYGEIVEDIANTDMVQNQLTISDIKGFEDCKEFDAKPLPLKTTGCNRTGCMFCGYGCHLEKGEGRFERMKRTHPKQYEWIMKPWSDGGLGYKFVIDWLNENGNLNIKY